MKYKSSCILKAHQFQQLGENIFFIFFILICLCLLPTIVTIINDIKQEGRCLCSTDYIKISKPEHYGFARRDDSVL